MPLCHGTRMGMPPCLDPMTLAAMDATECATNQNTASGEATAPIAIARMPGPVPRADLDISQSGISYLPVHLRRPGRQTAQQRLRSFVRDTDPADVGHTQLFWKTSKKKEREEGEQEGDDVVRRKRRKKKKEKEERDRERFYTAVHTRNKSDDLPSQE